jgi:hypothetical protein
MRMDLDALFIYFIFFYFILEKKKKKRKKKESATGNCFAVMSRCPRTELLGNARPTPTVSIRALPLGPLCPLELFIRKK